MLFVYPVPQYPRRPLEYVFKSLYLICTAIHCVALVVLISDFYTRLRNSMPGYFSHRRLKVSDGIVTVMQNCTYTGEVSLGSVRGNVTIGLGSITIGLMDTAMYVQGLFVVQFLLIVNCGFCYSNSASGNRHLRIFGVHVPLYHILVVFTYVYSITIIVLTWVFQANRNFYHRAIVHCANKMKEQDPNRLNHIEFSDYTIFSTAVYWPFASVCFSLLIYFMATFWLCWFSYDKATILLSEADAPWEASGYSCATKKPLLRIHTAQRLAILQDARKAMEDGEKVRIVRSYQLMTEEDFQELITAMKEQAARALKEKQFEMMKENLGDNESMVDEPGLQWRHMYNQHHQHHRPHSVHHLSHSPHNADGGQQPRDMGFDEYFMDNDYRNPDNGGSGDDGLFPFQNPQYPQYPLQPGEAVEYDVDPLFPPEDDFAQQGGGGGGGGYGPPGLDDEYYGPSDGMGVQSGAPYYDDSDPLNRNSTNFTNGEDYNVDWDNPSVVESGMGGMEEPSRHRHHHRRRHRRHSSSGMDGAGEEGPYYYDEPDPRSPGMDDYSPQEGGSNSATYDDGWWSAGARNGGGGGGGQPRNSDGGASRPRGSGRQAEVEDDFVEADALSDDDGEFY